MRAPRRRSCGAAPVCRSRSLQGQCARAFARVSATRASRSPFVDHKQESRASRAPQGAAATTIEITIKYFQMQTFLKNHFAELRSHRRAELDKRKTSARRSTPMLQLNFSVVEQAQKCRDSDVCSFFNNLQELNHPSSSESTSSADDEASTSRARKPRRVRTWNLGNAHTQSRRAVCSLHNCFRTVGIIDRR